MPRISKRKEPSRRIRGYSASIHTRLAIVPVSISHTENPHNTQDMKYKGTQKGLALVVEKS